MKKQYTVSEWFNEWLETYIKPCRKPKTYLCYQDSIRRILQWNTTLGAKAIQEVNELEVQEFINVMADMYAKSTLNDMRVVFHQAFESAVRNRLLDNNPIGQIAIPECASEKSIRALTREEQRIVEDTANRDPLGHLVLFFLNTGLRAGELCNLKWTDYDEINNLIYIRSSKTRAGVRCVPVIQAAKKVIDAQPRICEYIFTSTIRRQITPTVLKKLYARIRKATGLSFITNHVYRHTFATRLVERDVDYKALSTLLGHTSIGFTMKRYVHPQNDFLREQISLLEKPKAV